MPKRKITVHSYKHTRLLHIILLALTDGQTDGETNTLAVRGLEELRVKLMLKRKIHM
jgi:hypothetical protein